MKSALFTSSATSVTGNCQLNQKENKFLKKYDSFTRFSGTASTFLTSTISPSPSSISKWELKTGLRGISDFLNNSKSIKSKNNGAFQSFKAMSTVFRFLFKALKFLTSSFQGARIKKLELGILIEALIKKDTWQILSIQSRSLRLMIFSLVTARSEEACRFSSNKKV
jgi:hypothetical protein